MMLTLAFILACRAQEAPPPAVPPDTPPRFVLVEGSTVTQVGGRELTELPFDQIAADLDLDGDEDVLVNRHLNGLLLLENDDGVLLPRDRREASAGLDVSPGVRTLFGVRSLLDTHSEPGVVLYQVHGSGGVFDLVLQAARRGKGPASVQVSLSETFTLEDETGITRLSDREIRVPFPPKGERTSLRMSTRDNAPRLDLVQLDATGKATSKPLPWFIGGKLSRFDGASLGFWVPDPHGMAIAPIFGARPDLVVARGGNVGKLNTTHQPKEHDLYRAAPGTGPTFERVDGALPSDTGRSRSLEWVDIDNDGKNELYLSNRDGPPALLVWSPLTKVFQDRHAVHGLAGVCGEVTAWIDLDDDGWQDLVALCGGGLRTWQNLGAGAFVEAPVVPLSLDSEAVASSSHGWLREEAILVLDVNGDDRLDLWLVGVGKDRGHRVLLGGAAGFRDATAELGLAGAVGARDATVFDADMDGWLDVFVGGEPSHLLWNRSGDGLERIELDDLFVDGVELDRTRTRLLPFRPSADAPRDDLMVSGRRWGLARNATENEARLRYVTLPPAPSGVTSPVGALVRAFYDDGHVQRVRVGSNARTRLSQAIPEVRFGLPTPGAITRIEVRWPGSSEWVVIP